MAMYGEEPAEVRSQSDLERACSSAAQGVKKITKPRSQLTQPRGKKGKKRALENIDKELDNVNDQMASHRPMSVTSHFLLSLDSYLTATPATMLPHLQIELIHIASQYSQGTYPKGLLIRNSTTLLE